jgi:hypothetical protein
MAGSCEYGDEALRSGTTDLVSYLINLKMIQGRNE